jgi:hypothetical protein
MEEMKIPAVCEANWIQIKGYVGSSWDTINITTALTCATIGGSKIVKLIAEISLGKVDQLKVNGMSGCSCR